MFKHARTQLGLTQAEMARVLNVDAVTISRWENGQPTNRVVPRFLDALVFLHSLGKLEEFKAFHYTGQEIKQQVEKRGHCALAAALRRVLREEVDQCSSKHECS